MIGRGKLMSGPQPRSLPRQIQTLFATGRFRGSRTDSFWIASSRAATRSRRWLSRYSSTPRADGAGGSAGPFPVIPMTQRMPCRPRFWFWSSGRDRFGSRARWGSGSLGSRRVRGEGGVGGGTVGRLSRSHPRTRGGGGFRGGRGFSGGGVGAGGGIGGGGQRAPAQKFAGAIECWWIRQQTRARRRSRPI